MIPESRSSNRSNLTQGNQPSVESYDPDTKEIFNMSFYQQKIASGDTYHSVEHMKRYVNETNLGVIIQKIMGTLLSLEKLPYNPYNLMYRMIHHQTIYQNLKRHYNHPSQQHNFINSNLQEQPDDYDSNSPQEEGTSVNTQETFTEIKIKDKLIFTTSRLSKYLNMANLYVFFKIVSSKRILERFETGRQKFNIDQIHLSFGGPLILNLRGNNGNLDVPVKLPRQAADKSIYCAQSMITTTVYVQANRQLSKCFLSFVDFIIQDVRESMQFKDEYHTVFFQKLQIINIDEIFSLIEFSREQIINNSGLIQKELLRILEKENVIIRSKNVYRLSKEIVPAIGEEFVTVCKEYTLIAEEEGLNSMVSNQPLRYVFKEVFFSEEVIDIVTESPDYKHKDLLAQYKKEMVYHLLYQLKMQNTSYLVWEIFYYLIYQNRSNRDNIEFVNQIQQTISYILISPIGFVYQLQHSLKTVKWLTLASFPTHSEDQAYSIVISLERDITAFIQRGNYIYWELQIFYEAIKMLLSIIVEIKQLKISALKFLVDHALLLLSGVTTNFNHILVVLQGNITNYLNVMCQILVAGKEEIQKIITYDLFLKEKQLPTSVLRVNEETKKLKKQLSMQESEVKAIILGKYIAKHQFYQKIYEFYWDLAIGKKVMYPLSRFLKLLMINSTQCNYDSFKANYTPPKYKVEQNIVNSVAIYEINQTQSSTVFYALHPDSLQVQAFKQYKTILDLIEPFLQSGSNQGGLGYRYGSKISVESLNSNNSSKTNRKIVSIKSIDMGDNISEESSSFSVCKVLVDLVLGFSFSSKNEIYSFVLEQINSLMERLDSQGFSILGLFPYNENHYDAESYDDHLYSKIFNEENCLRFDYKKKMQLDKFAKFLDYNINQGRFIQIRVIYMVREVTKVLNISVNFHYKMRQNYASLFRTHYAHERVFPSKKDILNWCDINPQTKQKATQQATGRTLTSLKKLEEQKEVSIVEVLSEKEMGEKDKKQGGISKFKYYRQSPFYNLLRKIGETIEVFLTVLEYLKSDRRGRFDLSHMQGLYQLLKFYLLDRCIIKDDYIYSEGASVSMVNLVMLLKNYFQKHPDNVGQEKELLQFEKILRKLWSLVKYAEISCTICIQQSLNVKGKEDQ